MAARGKDVLMKRGLVALTLLFALIPLACGGSEALSPEDAVAEAVTNSLDAGTSGVSLELTMTGIGDKPVTITGEGVQDSRQHRARFTFDLSGVGELSGGGVQLSEIELLLDGFTLYMNLPFLEIAGLKPWVEIDLQALAQEEGFDLGSLRGLSQTDPSQVLRYLQAASDDIEEVGEEDVRGVGTTRYRISIDVDKVAQLAPVEARAAIEALLAESGLETIPAEVWIDGDGLVRRIELAYEGMEFTPGQKGDMTLRVELYDYGVGVEVQPPPADQVMPFQELLELGGDS
jgi:hypothetical protein